MFISFKMIVEWNSSNSTIESLRNKSKIVKANLSHIDVLLCKVETIILFIILMFTFFGNLSVILQLLFLRKKKQKQISFMNCLNLNKTSRMSFFILNLSFADLNVVFMSIFPQILWKLRIDILSGSELACKLVTFCQVFSVYGSTFILVVIAYDRYSSICKPFKSISWTHRGGIRNVCIAWTIAFFVSCPQLLVFKLVQNSNNQFQCFAIFIDPKPTWERIYLIYHLFGQLVIPTLLLTFFYSKIFIAVSKNFKPENQKENIPLRPKSISFF